MSKLEQTLVERLAMKNQQLSEIHIAFCRLIEAESHAKKKVAKKELYAKIKESFRG